MLSDQESMCRVVKDYFIKLFSHADSRVEEGLVNNNIVITEAQNYKLTEEFTFDYFSLVVKQMHRDKSVGPDGLNPAFYQNFWNVLGQEVFQCYLKWLNEVSFPTKLNDTTIVLVPKRDGADCMKDLRPIALCNKKRGDEGVIALKLDMSKAYDRVDWDFQKMQLEQMGFSSKWIAWIMLCVSTVSYFGKIRLSR
ncbi:uncharacterized protein LOC135150356 [Daucus carota subsp. sativus]|uniref:uncharacterized protein LOC135150356 n=1 Tax=Daucus carota subsp. sativus TaxID=79200 RepID=UPI003082EAA5